MSLDKAIESGKERRKQYYGSKRFDPSCRSHGDCGWCKDNKQYKTKKKYLSHREQIKELENDTD